MSGIAFAELMAELARAADIADLAIEDDRYACLTIDDTFALHSIRRRRQRDLPVQQSG